MANVRGQSKSGGKSTVKARPARPAKPAKAAKSGKPAKQAKPAKVKLAKSVKPAKAAKPEKPLAAQAVQRVERPAKVERIEKFDAKSSGQPEAFRLVAIERAEPPNGAAGKNWFRYTIRQGGNAINGYLQGTANGVKTAAEQIVGQLNERRAGRWGYRTTRAAAPAQSG